MTKNAPAISPDQPLSRSDAIERDRLQRTGFAKAAVAALARVSATAGFVLSIEGPWGSGKTSTLSMMEQLIREENEEGLIVVHFNPWIVGDRESLLRQFLGAIASAIELTDHIGSANKVAKEIRNYAKVFDLVKWVPGAEPWASLIKGVMESAGKAAGGVAEQKERDIEGQKDRLERALQEFDKRVFVFIDDIDRLFPSEVFEMVRIVKAVGQLPNVGYIVAWDAEYIRRALRSASVPRASTYIDKIVQVRLPLPAISTNSRLNLINDALSSLPVEALAWHFPKQDERLQHVYFHGLRELLEQPRDISRVINTLAVIEPGLRGEIVLADIFGLACLMVRAPRVYDELRRNPSLFTRGFGRPEADTEAEKKKHSDKLEQVYAKTQNH
ncbi:KAP family P-loop NTPase fold protein [Marilutibacter maris]|uniref:KAP family P-loop NTPase fold protein n=1 Tax=Marilutibacter maris TaxID=1605891 RepID=UPI000DA97993|nr:P-loop NTPase fold protein [Lysobacter maris]